MKRTLLIICLLALSACKENLPPPANPPAQAGKPALTETEAQLPVPAPPGSSSYNH